MPRGSHLTNTDTVEKRIEKRAENKKELQKFFVHINDTLRVTRDNYNTILLSKRVAEGSGRMYAFPEAYYSLPESVVDKAKQRGATEEEIAVYLKKIKGISVTFDDGNLIMDLPKTFKADPVDLETTEE